MRNTFQYLNLTSLFKRRVIDKGDFCEMCYIIFINNLESNDGTLVVNLHFRPQLAIIN